MAPKRKAKPLPRPRTAGTNVKRVVSTFGGRGKAFQKTVRPLQEAAMLHNGPKIVMKPTATSPGQSQRSIEYDNNIIGAFGGDWYNNEPDDSNRDTG
jgi:hypothetical protein